MKALHSINKLIFSLFIVLLFSKCGGDIEGTFYLSEEARKYQIDTSILSVRLIDNYGISEEFYMDQNIWYTTHNYFSEWGVDGKAWGETYGVAYHSSVNRFFFMFVLRADVEHTDLEIEWNQKDRTVFNFATKKTESGVRGRISLYDSLTVRGIRYYNIIELDYSERIDEIDDDTPVKTYISGDKGLLKFIRKDNIVLERVR